MPIPVPDLPGYAEAQPCAGGFAALGGWVGDDHAAAFAAFHASAVALLGGADALRPAAASDSNLAAAARAAVALGPAQDAPAARAFFETWFEPWRVGGAPRADAFFTGYYEPVVDGALTPSDAFAAPLLARPADLVTFAAEDARPDWAAGLAAARRAPDGTLTPYPDRAAIEDAAAAGHHRPIVWLRDWVEVFLIHVQGSARLRLPDGRMLRATYAGRNGQPYTSIGRILVEDRQIERDAMSLDRLKAWIRAAGQAVGEPGRSLMRRNASSIFFDGAIDDGAGGPTGGQGVRLAALRSIAVDRGLWCYGLPFWVEADLPWRGEPAAPARFARLMIAQDTGSAIVGPARVDLFFGSGAAAGILAGGIRHAGSLTVLRPRASPA